jgi:hypothetical protein
MTLALGVLNVSSALVQQNSVEPNLDDCDKQLQNKNGSESIKAAIVARC